jgi:hypothetical protein
LRNNIGKPEGSEDAVIGSFKFYMDSNKFPDKGKLIATFLFHCTTVPSTPEEEIFWI